MATILEFPKVEQPAESKTWATAEAVANMFGAYTPLRARATELFRLLRSLLKETLDEEEMSSVIEAAVNLRHANKQFFKDMDKYSDLALEAAKQDIADRYLQGIAMGLSAVDRLDALPSCPGAIEALERSTWPRHQEILKKVRNL